jgi:type IV pilus assembly protein PilY1
MRNIRSLLGSLWGALLSLYLAAPVYGFTPSESPLLSAAAVTPNVMLLIDDSGSMNNIKVAAVATGKIFWRTTETSCLRVYFVEVAQLAGTASIDRV